MMTLRVKQSAFVQLVARLVQYAEQQGFTLTFGECWRSPEEAARLATIGKGIKASLHTQRLAIDLNLFRDGVYQRGTEAYRLLGEWWEAQSGGGIECCWGGRFKDGGHFSIGHGGRK